MTKRIFVLGFSALATLFTALVGSAGADAQTREHVLLGRQHVQSQTLAPKAAPKPGRFQTYRAGRGGGLAGPGGFKSPTGGLPSLSQVGGYSSKAYTQHESCGAGCWTHGLTNENGNLDMTVKIGFSCPAGDAVGQIWYDFVPGVGMQQVYAYNGGAQHQQRIETVKIQPWTPAQFEAAANQALGGDWFGPQYPAGLQSGQTAMHQTVRVIANCINDDTTRHKDFVVHSQLTAIDTDWAPPVGVQTSQGLAENQ